VSSRSWRPFEAAGRPEERLPEVREALGESRPLASESCSRYFQRKMTRASEQAFWRAQGRR